MGSIYKLKCENKDYEETLYLGSGMRYPGFNGGYEAAFCGKCNEYTRVMTDRDRNNEIAGDAECCGTREGLRIIKDIETEELTCPLCGGKIKVTMEGHWD